MSHPLIDRLTQEMGWPELANEHDVHEFTNAILLRHWEYFVLWKQSGYAVSATLAVILFANRRSLCTMRQTFDLFPMSGRVVWMEFLKKCTAKVQALRVS